MFCPNCGNDCGNAKFCTHCGKNLQQNTKTTYADVSAGGHGQLTPPIGIYKCVSATLELTPDAVIICKSFPNSTRKVVSYSQIRFVTHMQRTKTQNNGFLSIYTWQSKEPMVTSGYQALHDSMSVLYNWRFDDEIFFMLFQFLSGCASRNRANWLKMKEEALSPGILQMAQSKYTLKYYRQYYPNKQEAICAMTADTGLSEADAAPVINYVFDVFNNEIYEKFEDSLGLPYKVTCPKCSSHRIASKERGFDHLKTSIGLSVSPAIGLYLATKDADKEQYVCMKCGYVWYQE